MFPMITKEDQSVYLPILLEALGNSHQYIPQRKLVNCHGVLDHPCALPIMPLRIIPGTSEIPAVYEPGG
eukprot:2460057-Lingulodinium_polyedra.AAC.1